MATFELPEETLRNILSRLPVKSLLQFRSVCKSWCSLFKNPDFIAENHNYATLNSLYTSLLLKKGKDVPFSVFDSSVDGYGIVTVFTPGFFEYPVIKGSVNGLICLHDEGKDLIALFNPATREFKSIPLPQFNPSIRSRSSYIGFGFNKKTNDYNILSFVFNSFHMYNSMGLKKQVHLYSLKNDSWKEISSPDDVLIVPTTKTWSYAYMDGVYFWWGEKVRDANERFILSFDFANEVFEKLFLPDSISTFYPNQISQLAIIDGMLSVVNCDEASDEEIKVDIWSMTQHGVKESWKELKGPFHFDICMMPLGFWKNYLILTDLHDEKLVFCDLSTKQMHNCKLTVSGDIQVSYYAESLVPIYNHPPATTETFRSKRQKYTRWL